MNRRRLSRALMSVGTCCLLLLLSAPRARAADGGGQVSGTVELAPANQLRETPKLGEGFVPRAKNPLQVPAPYDPRRFMVVVLDGGPVDDSDRKPHSATYDIIGENFETEILPVVVGSKVEIKNKGRKSPRLYSKTLADVVPGDPINKNGVRLTAAIQPANKAIDIRDLDSIHMLGRIVAFDHAYFSVVDENGKFSIEGVPAGNWTVKIWYQDGWVTNIPATSVNVAAHRGAKGVDVKLPAKLQMGAKAQ